MEALKGVSDMTDKEAIRNALEYYILVNAATERDPGGKVNSAKRCLEELDLSEKVTKDWMLNKYSITYRSISVYREYLNRYIREHPNSEDTSREKEELRILDLIWTLFDNLPELPL